MRHFAQELEELNQAVLQMGGFVESSMHCSVQALQERDERLANRIIEDEPRINQMEMDIDSRVTRLLALQQPVARDLRFLTSVLKINGDLERVGDLAVHIARRTLSLIHRPPMKDIGDIPKMAALAEDMLHKSLDAFVKQDAELAESVLPVDAEVNELRDRVFTEVVQVMQTEPDNVPSALDLMFVARHLERTADHSTNIAEDVIFLVRGEDVRHHALR
ncbi:MAG TPA: phosphate signaling complex protein PhoU [Bryobacteraceae bacterium]|nr:phosphate signaling complex protein PhoU [Bryobacteraceae bacterium]